MVEQVEVKQAETTAEKPVEENRPTQSKPEGLPEKFNSVEELVKSYSELEKKQSTPEPIQPQEPEDKTYENEGFILKRFIDDENWMRNKYRLCICNNKYYWIPDYFIYDNTYNT